MPTIMGDFPVQGMALRYSQFMPKLYNYCLSLGFDPRRIMPSRAFCSDESQGYPVILMARHFGTFPFDHGQVGGRVATDRHGPHAHHGEDLLIIQASHVGFDAKRQQFGVYPRRRTQFGQVGANCGKLAATLEWYQCRYAEAAADIRLGAIEGAPAVFIDNALLDPGRSEGLFLDLERVIDPVRCAPMKVLSTAKAFAASPLFVAAMGGFDWTEEPQPIGERLTSELFTFRRKPVIGAEGEDLLEAAIAHAMPALVTSAHPLLDAARRHTQIEFDRTYRSLLRDPAYEGKNLLFLSGLNIDVGPDEGLLFPLTKFVPWAAFARLRNGRQFLLEQAELFDALAAQPDNNPNEVPFDAAIAAMVRAEGVVLPLV